MDYGMPLLILQVGRIMRNFYMVGKTLWMHQALVIPLSECGTCYFNARAKGLDGDALAC